jgi:hypothetical protein
MPIKIDEYLFVSVLVSVLRKPCQLFKPVLGSDTALFVSDTALGRRAEPVIFRLFASPVSVGGASVRVTGIAGEGAVTRSFGAEHPWRRRVSWPARGLFSTRYGRNSLCN